MQIKPLRSPWSVRIRIALIPALLALLGGTLYWPKRPEGESTSVELPTAKTSPPSAVQNLAYAESEAAWNDIDVSLVKASNPFVGLENSEKTSIDLEQNQPLISVPRETRTIAINALRVQAISETLQGFTALVDGQLVREGDVLSDGTRVLAVSQQGVLVEFK